MTRLYDGMLKVCVCMCEREREKVRVSWEVKKREKKFPSGFGIIWTNSVVDDSVEVGVKKESKTKSTKRSNFKKFPQRKPITNSPEKRLKFWHKTFYTKEASAFQLKERRVYRLSVFFISLPFI